MGDPLKKLAREGYTSKKEKTPYLKLRDSCGWTLDPGQNDWVG